MAGSYYLVVVPEFGAAKCVEYAELDDLIDAARESAKAARQLFVFAGLRWPTSKAPDVRLMSPAGDTWPLSSQPPPDPVADEDGFVTEEAAESVEVVAPAATPVFAGDLDEGDLDEDEPDELDLDG